MMTDVKQAKPFSIIAGIFFIFILLFIASLISTAPVMHWAGLTKVTSGLFFVSRMTYWLCLVLLWGYSVKIEKQSLVIWEEKKLSLSVYLLSVIALFFILFAGMIIIQLLLTISHLKSKSDALYAIIALLKDNKFLLIFTALTAGVVEELIFRGYLQPRLELLFKSPALAIIVSSLLFGLLHYKYGTVINVAGPVFIGLVFACYYKKYKNIKVLIACHFLWDLLSLFLLIKNH